MQKIHLPPLAEGEIHLCSLWLPNQGLTHTVLLPGDHDRAKIANAIRRRGHAVNKQLTKTYRGSPA